MMTTLEQNRIARRYARALFEAAQMEGFTGTVFEDLKTLHQLFAKSPEVSLYFETPAVPEEEKFVTIQAQLKGPIHALVLLMLKQLIIHERVALLPAVTALYQEIVEQHDKIATAYVTTAVELDTDLAEKLQRTLESSLGYRTIKLQKRVDPSIIAGVIVQVEDKVLDGSYATRLESLRKRIG